MKPKFQLTKLSSGDSLYLETDDSYVLMRNLEMYCCVDCQSEAKVEMEAGVLDENLEYAYQLLSTACGAEFWLEEITNE